MKKQKCPRCNKGNAITHNIYGILPCESCQAEDEKNHLQTQPEFYSISKHNRVTEQRDKHAKDILQPFEKRGEASPDFAKAYPTKVDDYYTKDQLKKL